MAFYIYQNIPNSKVTIHRGECRFCNEGHGLQQNPLGDANGQWFIAPDNGYPNYAISATVAHIRELLPEVVAFWPEAKGKVHLDAWREVNYVDGYTINVVEKNSSVGDAQLFFINLGG